MKKYLFGLFAVILAVGFSSFGLLNKADSSFEESLYWYPVESDNTIDHNSLVNPSSSTPMTKTQLRNNSLIPCEEVSGPDCIRGFRALQDDDNTDDVIDFTEKAE